MDVIARLPDSKIPKLRMSRYLDTSSVGESRLYDDSLTTTITLHNTSTSWRSDVSIILPGWSITRVGPVDTHSTPVLTTVRRLWVALPQNKHHEMTPQQNKLNMVAEQRLTWRSAGLQRSGTRFHRRRKTTLSRRVAWFDHGDGG